MRILFADDEPQLLEGLRDLLRRQRGRWTMTFAAGGEAALHELEAGGFDVVVSDMRMPSVDGAAVLARARERQPQAVRIVLSGQTDDASALRAAPLAHQFLTKPVAPDELVAAIERAALLRGLLGSDAVREVAARIGSLPSSAALYGAITGALADPDATLADVGGLVAEDIALSAKVLQLVNSSFYGLGRRIASIDEAVRFLGLGSLKALALATDAFRAWQPAQDVAGFSVAELERHSALVARAAAASLRHGAEADDAFAGGLLHDVGKLVLAAELPDELGQLLAEARASGRRLHEVERERAGYTHAELGGYLLSLWGLPENLVEAVAAHHELPESAGAAARAVHAANEAA